MSLYTSEYKSDHVTKDTPIRWIWLKQSVNRKNAIIQNIIILKYKYTENYRKYNKRKTNTETSMEKTGKNVLHNKVLNSDSLYKIGIISRKNALF